MKKTGQSRSQLKRGSLMLFGIGGRIVVTDRLILKIAVLHYIELYWE